MEIIGYSVDQDFLIIMELCKESLQQYVQNKQNLENKEIAHIME